MITDLDLDSIVVRHSVLLNKRYFERELLAFETVVPSMAKIEIRNSVTVQINCFAFQNLPHFAAPNLHFAENTHFEFLNSKI